jgi:hypothetical protein
MTQRKAIRKNGLLTSAAIRFLLLTALLGTTAVRPSRLLAENTLGVTDAVQLWNLVLSAKGGRQRLETVSSMYVSTKAQSGSANHDLYVFPDFSFSYSYWPSRERVDIVVYNAKRSVSWWQEGADAAQVERDTETASEAMKEALFTFLLHSKWINAQPLRIRKERTGLKRLDVVETDVDGWRVDYYLNSTTHLPLKVVYGYSKIERAEGVMNRIVRLEDYKEVGGIMMPHRLIFSFTDGPEKSDQRATYEINVDYDEAIFEHPPTPGMKPNAWRRPTKP